MKGGIGGTRCEDLLHTTLGTSTNPLKICIEDIQCIDTEAIAPDGPSVTTRSRNQHTFLRLSQ